MSAPVTATDRRPVWQTKPCPSWCTATHHSADVPGSRLCADGDTRVILSREETVSAGHGTWLPEEMSISMEQPTTGGDPFVLLYRTSGDGVEMTLDEAESVAVQILSRVMEARNEQTSQRQEASHDPR